MSLFAAWLLLLAGLALVGALAVWVLAPLHAGGALLAADDARLLALLTEREGTLAGLRDLDADLASGRISAPTHEAVREELLGGGSRIMAAIDESMERVAGDRHDALARLEAAVAARLGRPPVERRKPTQLMTTCPTCGRVTATEDRFCRHCGHDLNKGKLV